MKTYKYAAYIGRFQPVHNGHLHNIRKGLNIAETLIVILGSANQPSTIKNPWSVSEREIMIRSCLSYDENSRIVFKSVVDYKYNFQDWIKDVQTTVNSITNDEKVALIGHKKDDSSYYINHFPQWDFIETSSFLDEKGQTVDATAIREQYFKRMSLPDTIPDRIVSFLKGYELTSNFTNLVSEYQFIKDYKEQWSATPYPVIFTTVDAVVIQSGHILLIRRESAPGKGLWALPGGFVGQSETLVDSCIRELREETQIKVPEKILRASIFANKVFDDPSRSERGRTITYAFGILLEGGHSLPRIRGSDDADKAQWFTFEEVDKMRHQMYEDHYDIAHYFIHLS